MFFARPMFVHVPRMVTVRNIHKRFALCIGNSLIPVREIPEPCNVPPSVCVYGRGTLWDLVLAVCSGRVPWLVVVPEVAVFYLI